MSHPKSSVKMNCLTRWEFIHRVDCNYPSGIVPIILRVRLSFQLGILPQLFSAIADFREDWKTNLGCQVPLRLAVSCGGVPCGGEGHQGYRKWTRLLSLSQSDLIDIIQINNVSPFPPKTAAEPCWLEERDSVAINPPTLLSTDAAGVLAQVDTIDFILNLKIDVNRAKNAFKRMLSHRIFL